MKEIENVIEIYNDVADDYYELCKDNLYHQGKVEKFLSLLDGKRILDAGCGFGKYSKFFIEKGFEPIGIDLADDLLKIARRDVPTGKFEKVDITSLPYDDNSFEGVVAMFSLQHVPTKLLQKTIQGFWCVLKPSGILLIGVQEGKTEEFIAEPFKPGKKIFTNLKTQVEWRKLLGTNFEIIEMEVSKTESQMDLAQNNILIIAKKRDTQAVFAASYGKLDSSGPKLSTEITF